MLSDILKVYTTTQVTQLLNARKSPGEENDTSSTAEPVSARSLFRSLVEEDPTQSVMDLDMSSQDCYRQTPDCASMSSAPELDCTMDIQLGWDQRPAIPLSDPEPDATVTVATVRDQLPFGVTEDTSSATLSATAPTSAVPVATAPAKKSKKKPDPAAKHPMLPPCNCKKSCATRFTG